MITVYLTSFPVPVQNVADILPYTAGGLSNNLQLWVRIFVCDDPLLAPSLIRPSNTASCAVL